MGNEFNTIEFFNKTHDAGPWPRSMSELVRGWLDHSAAKEGQSTGAKDDALDWAFDCTCELARADGDLTLDFVLAVLDLNPDDKMRAILAAGPLEDTLAYHGPEIIDRTECLARQSPTFRHLLGGVWQNSMQDAVWDRVQKARSQVW